MTQSDWGFYGRRDELSRLAGILGRGRWCFAWPILVRREGALCQDGYIVSLDELQYVNCEALFHAGQRRAADARGYLPQDLTDLTQGLLP